MKNKILAFVIIAVVFLSLAFFNEIGKTKPVEFYITQTTLDGKELSENDILQPGAEFYIEYSITTLFFGEMNIELNTPIIQAIEGKYLLFEKIPINIETKNSEYGYKIKFYALPWIENKIRLSVKLIE